MNDTPRLVLASASVRRRDLLNELGIPHEVIPAGEVAERQHDEDLAPSELVEYNARLKAAAVCRDHPEAVVLGSDTLVFLDGEALPKPADLEQAREFLMRLSGRTHQVITGVCLAGPGPGRLVVFHDTTRVSFRPLGAGQVAEYLDQVEVLDKAGAYAIQEHGELIIERIEGSRSNVIGLPLERLEQELRAQGWGHLLSSS